MSKILIMADGTNIYYLLQSAAAKFPDKIFLYGNLELSYRDSLSMVDTAARHLMRLGVQKGDRVAVMSKNRAEIVLAAFAIARQSAIFVPLHPGLKPTLLKDILDQVQPSVMLLGDESYQCDSNDLGLGHCCLQRLIGLFANDVSIGRVSLTQIENRDTDPVCLIFTTGSTGEPKGITISHRNVLFTTAAIQERLNYQTEDRIGLFLPIAFDYGLYQFFLASNAGASVYIGDLGEVGPQLLGVLKKRRASVLPAVPAIISCLLRLNSRRNYRLPDLKKVTNTGEVLNREQIRGLLDSWPQLQIYPMYGLTECKRVSILLPQELARKHHTVGRPLDGTIVYAIDPHGRRLGAGETGELCVEGLNVTLGYWRSRELICDSFERLANVEQSTRLRTGDMGSVDGEGFVTFISRKDSLIKHRGYRLSPLEIETTINVSPLVSEVLVKKDENTQKLVCFIVARKDANRNSIREYIKQNLESYRMPDEIIFRDAMPLNQNGKYDRGRIASGTLENE